MKKVISLLLILCMIFCLAACGGSGEKQPEKEPEKKNEDTPKETPADSFTFVYNKNQIRIDDDMAEVLKLLGKEKSYYEAESCAFKGLDKTYTYPSFIISTRPEGNKDYVLSIQLLDDSVTTYDGLYIGCTEQQVKDKLGEGLEGILSYSNGNEKMEVFLDFVVQNGVVTSISYSAGKR